MARGINKVILIGNLGSDPEFREIPNGGGVVNFSVATSEQWKDKNTGEKREQTEWHRIVIYGRLAEVCRDYLRKGIKVYLEGKNKTRKWTDQQGVERYTTEVVCHDMQMLDGQAQGQGQQQGGYQSQQQPRNTPPTHAGMNQGQGPAPSQDYDDDIPF